MKKVVHLISIFVACILLNFGCKSTKTTCSNNKNKKSANIMYAQHKKSNTKYNQKSYTKKVSNQQKKCRR